MKSQQFNDNWQFGKNIDDMKFVTLPHDAMLFEERRSDNVSTGACANFDGGVYHYKKKFVAESDWQNQCVQLYFEGAYRNSKVYLNGNYVGGCKYGYTSFVIELSGKLNIGTENEVHVIVDNSDMPNGRWYTGSGIYRPVWLLLGEREHIIWQGVKISTVSISPAVINVKTSHAGGEVSVQITKDGRIVAEAQGDDANITIADACLWSEETPNLYTCIVTLKKDGKVVDSVEENFGIRQITWSNKGLFINGKETLLKGGCLHSDNGILGAASFRESEWRRVKILKKYGFNAIRCSHNPCSEELLKACDYYGMYVIDEGWDMWFNHKNKADYAADFLDNYENDIESMINKDFNHPSVILYSIANEISEPSSQKGMKLAHKIIDKFHELDSSRPVTGGINLMIIYNASRGKGIYSEDGGINGAEIGTQVPSSMMFNVMTNLIGSGMTKAANSDKADIVTTPILDALDIAGYNYGSGRYPLEGKKHPDRTIVGTETFVWDLPKNWEMVKRFPYLVGDFMWTAWDYIGEAGAGTWGYTKDSHGFEKPYPWILADMGVLDILGNPTGEAYLAAAVWNTLKAPQIAVRPVNHTTLPAKSSWRGTNSIPSWSWKGCEGNKAVIEVFGDYAFVELYLNNKLVGKKKFKNFVARLKTKYIPGVLTAKAYDVTGKLVAENTIQSAVGNCQISIESENESIAPDGLCYININIVGDNGVIESNCDKELAVSVEGGELLGFGSANPRTEESYVKGIYTTYYGRSQAIVRTAGYDLKVKVTDIKAGKTVEKTFSNNKKEKE